MAPIPVLLAALFGILLANASSEIPETPAEAWIASSSAPVMDEVPMDEVPAEDAQPEPMSSETPNTDGAVEPIRRPSEHPMSTPKDWRKRLRMKDPTRSGRSAYV